nr:RCC1 domain-containing protein [Myxococcus sp. SDU36]
MRALPSPCAACAWEAVATDNKRVASAGGLHSGTVRNGLVYTWGRNNRGQLDLGADVTTDQKNPQAVPGLESVTSIAFNQNFAMALTAGGRHPSLCRHARAGAVSRGRGGPGLPPLAGADGGRRGARLRQQPERSAGRRLH